MKMQWNWYGTWVLFRKENLRFLEVSLQTIFAPVITAILYLIIFLPIGDDMAKYSTGSYDYGLFLIPGLAMMTILQNAFANTSSSMIQSKFYGNILFLLVAPLSPMEIYLAFVGAAVIRGIIVGVAVFACGFLFYDVTFVHPFYALFFCILCSAVMGAMGLIVGIWAEKFDHLAGFQNFVLLPMTFLSGVFYSISKLPPLWQTISLLNPFLYMIDGLRYTALGVSDQPFVFAIFMVLIFLAILTLWCYYILKSGYKLRQ